MCHDSIPTTFSSSPRTAVREPLTVMAGFIPAIHVFTFCETRKTWMLGPSPHRSGFGRADGTSPGKTIAICEALSAYNT